MSFHMLLIPAFLSCLLNTVANTLWKMQFNKTPISFNSLLNIVRSIFTVNVIGGAFLYFGSMLIFFYMLSNFKLSVIMPIMCLTYIFNIAVGILLFKETLSVYQIMGTAVIIIGLIILSRAYIN